MVNVVVFDFRSSLLGLETVMGMDDTIEAADYMNRNRVVRVCTVVSSIITLCSVSS